MRRAKREGGRKRERERDVKGKRCEGQERGGEVKKDKLKSKTEEWRYSKYNVHVHEHYVHTCTCMCVLCE